MYMFLLKVITKLILIESVGCQIEINETGTLLKFKPGILLGGQSITHDCGASKCIGYFLEAIIVLLLFAKSPSKLSLNGITNDAVDLSVDTINSVTIPLLGRLLGITGLELKIRKRGFAPKGGGVVDFTCPIVRDLPPIEALEEGGAAIASLLLTPFFLMSYLQVM